MKYEPWCYRVMPHRDSWQEVVVQVGRYAGEPSASEQIGCVAPSGPGNVIATVFLGGPGGTSRSAEDVEATARLVAAAPDLLHVLETLLSCEEELSEFGERIAREVVELATSAESARAHGRTPCPTT